jgi:hypothetical protein
VGSQSGTYLGVDYGFHIKMVDENYLLPTSTTKHDLRNMNSHSYNIFVTIS